jgi:hypothetical protein
MSDKWKPELFGLDTQDDGTYRAWRTSTQSLSDFELVPASGSGEPLRYIPYLQAISMEYPQNGRQLCLMCHTTGHLIFIEGVGLPELAQQLSNRRVKSVHVFDTARHEPPDEGKAIVTKISVEKSPKL